MVDVVVVDSVVVLDAVVESDFEKYLTMNYDLSNFKNAYVLTCGSWCRPCGC